MFPLRTQFAFLLASVGLLCLPAGILAENAQVQVQEQAAGLTPTRPASALAQVPSGRAVVAYQSGKLTIMARNAPLSDVLRAVCTATGAVLDNVPPGADERIFAILGPGRAREVLASLLNDARFDYVIVGSAGDPNAVARFMVFPKTKGSNADKQVTQPPVSSTRAASIGEKAGQQQQNARPIQAKAGAAGSAGAASDSQGDANALDADAVGIYHKALGVVGSDANSPQVAPQAGAAGSDTPGAYPGGSIFPPTTRRHHRRR